jgi:hypothetical protein
MRFYPFRGFVGKALVGKGMKKNVPVVFYWFGL